MKHLRLYKTTSHGTVAGTGVSPGPEDELTQLKDFSWRELNSSENPFNYVMALVSKGIRLETGSIPGFNAAFDVDLFRKAQGDGLPGTPALQVPAWDDWTLVRCVGCSHLLSAEERTRLHGAAHGAERTALQAQAPAAGEMPDPKAFPYRYVRQAKRCEVFTKGPIGRSRFFVGPGDRIGVLPGGQNVMETEFTLWVNSRREIAGYTVGNDGTGHWIESLCTLYLCQAKEFWGCTALGPSLVILEKPVALDDPRPALPEDLEISLQIFDRRGVKVSGRATIGDLARMPQFYIDWATRYQDLSHGMFVMMGTGIMHPPGVGLEEGDVAVIHSPQCGSLVLGTELLQEYSPDYQDLSEAAVHRPS